MVSQRRTISDSKKKQAKANFDKVVKAYNLIFNPKIKVHFREGSTYTKFQSHFQNVALYLEKFGEGKDKDFFQMSVDYFKALKDARSSMKASYVRLYQVDGPFAKKTFGRFVYNRGDYFNDSWRKQAKKKENEQRASSKKNNNLSKVVKEDSTSVEIII